MDDSIPLFGEAPSGFRVSFLTVPTRATPGAPWVASIRKRVDTPVIWTTNEGSHP